MLLALLLVGLVLPVTPPGAAGASPGADDRPSRSVATPSPSSAASAPRCRGHVALTFDDGPAAGTTRRLIRILTEEKVPATFFVVGRRVRQHPELVREIAAAGFEIGNHSWSHRQMTAQSGKQVRWTLDATNQALLKAGVRPTRLMRPPYGAIDARVRRVITDAGYVPVLWSVDSRDWANGSSTQIARRILNGLRRGSNVVLQHDGVDRSAISVAAVRQVIRVARSRGYCFAALNAKGRPGSPAPATGPTPRQHGAVATAVLHEVPPADAGTDDGPGLLRVAWSPRSSGALPGWNDPRASSWPRLSGR